MTRWPLDRSLLALRSFNNLQATGIGSSTYGPISVVEKGRTSVGHQVPRTAVLILHHGQPRTPYYATKHLAESSHHYYKLPLWLTSRITQLYWPYAKKAGFCVDDYKYAKNFSYLINTYSEILEEYLDQLIPEHRPFHCTYAFLYEEPAIPKIITDLIRRGMQRLILLPIYPHYSCFRTGTMLSTAVEALDEQTLPLAKDGISVMDHRVRTMSHVSFRCSTIDRWSGHPAILNFWYNLLRTDLKDHDSILFVAPQMRGYNSSGYAREVWASCQRLMEHLNQAVPWKLAWFGDWDQWPATTLECIQLQLYLMRRDKRYRTLVVPITSLIPSFETESLLPMILQNEGVDLLQPPEYSPVLAHGFAELIKNHLMGRRASSQLSCRCKFCFSSRCLRREAMLAPKEIPSSEIFVENKPSESEELIKQQIAA